jgi:hypothetical protein
MVCFENREAFLSSVSETRYCIIGLLSCYASDRVNEWPANDRTGLKSRSSTCPDPIGKTIVVITSIAIAHVYEYHTAHSLILYVRINSVRGTHIPGGPGEEPHGTHAARSFLFFLSPRAANRIRLALDGQRPRHTPPLRAAESDARG